MRKLELSFRRSCNDAAQVEANMAFVYSQRGELAQAIDCYNHALTLDNTLRPAAHGLLNLSRVEQKVASADRRSRRPSDRAEGHPQESVASYDATRSHQPRLARTSAVTPSMPAEAIPMPMAAPRHQPETVNHVAATQSERLETTGLPGPITTPSTGSYGEFRCNTVRAAGNRSDVDRRTP